MIVVKEFFKYENANAIEVTWVELKQETETIIHCQAFSDSQIDLLRQTAKDFNTPISKEQEKIIKDVIANIVPPTKEELEAIAIENEKQRVLLIKQEAGRIIEIKYPIYKQNNILMSQNTDDIKIMNDYILAIRNISNSAELNKTQLSDINWSL